MYAEYYNEDQVNFTISNQLDRAYLIYQNFFIDPVSNTLDKEKLKKHLDNIIPDLNDTSYIILDWEGRHFNILRGIIKVSNSTYASIVSEFIEGILYAKSLRPKMKWSYYNFIPNMYPKVSASQPLIINKMMPLLKELDFLTTSLYLRDSVTENNRVKIDSFLSSNLQTAIRVGGQINKPVFPFVWQRYHDSQRSNSNITPVNFRWYVREILNSEHYNRKVDGVIWWNSESAIYRNRSKNKFFQKEYKQVSDPRQYQKDLFNRYFRSVSDLFPTKN